MPAAAGDDPKGDCTATVQTSCGDDGFCDGAFACRQWASGTQCTAEKCESGVGYAKELCDGLGTCQSVTGVACDPYVCGANACLTSCTTDAQCITTHYCASGSCEEKKVNGASCVTANECQSDQCVDGVCCENACDGTCSSCAVAGQLGSCTTYAASTDPDDECPTCQTCNGAGACANVSDGQDPLNECAQTPASTCGLDGVCDGSGACRQWASGTECVGASCSAGVQSNTDTCDGSGTCVDGGATPCTPYLCGGDLCASSCAADAECVTTHYCAGNACVSKKPNGDPCGGANECQSDFCTDGVCCESSCIGACESCNETGSAGSCTSHSQGTDPELGCGLYWCDGLGDCSTSCAGDADCKADNWCNGNQCEAKKPLGDACSGSNQCLSDQCVDGVCCASACNGLCEQCSAGTGSCDAVPTGQDPADECAGTGTCGGV